jgi:DNA mismatch repair ATPase MutS
VALNALFAQTLHCCLAESWSGPAVRLMTCIRRADSVLAGRSYYLSEAQGILDIIRAVDSAPPHVLCVLDEIFRGTNSLERIAAASAVLRYLASRGALVLAATHDHPLTERVADLYANAHFSERIGASGLEFDFLLKEGPATTSNAIALLDHFGYPREVVEAALRQR